MCFERQELTPTPKRPRPGVDLNDKKENGTPASGSGETGCCK
jgi:hypothetical protein